MTSIHHLLLAASVALVGVTASVQPAAAATDGSSNTLMISESFMDYTDDACVAARTQGARPL